MSDTLTWLLVGTGDIVNKRVAEALSTAPNSRMVGVCGSSVERVAAIASRVGATEQYTDLTAALRDTTADSVYIARPVYAHATEAVAALSAGKHVLVEKPFALNHAEAEDIVRAANRGESSGMCLLSPHVPAICPRPRGVAIRELGKITQSGWFMTAGLTPHPTTQSTGVPNRDIPLKV